MIKLRTFYPYTNESIEEVNQKLAVSDFDGIVLPIVVEHGRGDSFRILKQKQFGDGSFTSTSDVLVNFLRNADLRDKEVFLSVIDLFDALGGGGKSIEELQNYEALRKAISEIYGLTDKITINNNLYCSIVAREEFFPKLQQEFPGIDYAYTMFNRWDDLSEHQSIVPININCYDVVKYINFGKKIYLPQFEQKSSNRELRLEELLKYYKEDEEPRLGFSFNKADITIISKENANKVLTKVLESR